MPEEYISLANAQIKKCNIAYKMIENCEARILELDEELYSLKAVSYDGMPKGNGQVNYTLEHIMLKKQSLQLDIDKAYGIIEITNKMTSTFTEVEKQVIDVLIKGENLQELAENIYVSRATAYRTRRNALLKLGEIIYKNFR